MLVLQWARDGEKYGTVEPVSHVRRRGNGRRVLIGLSATGHRVVRPGGRRWDGRGDVVPWPPDSARGPHWIREKAGLLLPLPCPECAGVLVEEHLPARPRNIREPLRWPSTLGICRTCGGMFDADVLAAYVHPWFPAYATAIAPHRNLVRLDQDATTGLLLALNTLC